MRMTIDEIIGHCNRTCEMAEMFAIERGQTMDDITSKRYWEHYHVAKYLEELKRMKDAEEQGLLLRLPCKVGDTVYVINKRDNLITEEKVRDVQYRGESYQKGKRFFMNIGASIFFEDESGKLVFFDRKKAESALAEKGGAE